MRQASLQHGVFDNVLLAPVREPRPIMYGGIAEPDTLPAYCRHRIGGRIAHARLDLTGEDIDTLTLADDRPYIYGGMLTRHFGHFCGEHVHRLWLLSLPEFRDATVVYVTSKGGRVPAPFFADCMDYFGVRNWLILDRPTRVPRLAIGEQGKILKRPQNPAYEAELERLAGAHGLADGTRPRKVALMRGHMKKGRLLCESALDPFLEAEGYSLFRPEQHSLKDQLATLYNAEKIVISDGSSCHLFDMLPKLKADVAFIARRPGAQLDRNSIAPKARRVVSFNDVSLLAHPYWEDGRDRKNAGLGVASLEAIADFLKSNGFTEKGSEALPAPSYHEDMLAYSQAMLVGEGRSPDPADLMVEILARDMHARNMRIRELEAQLGGRASHGAGLPGGFVGWLRSLFR